MKRLDELRRQRDLAQIALGELLSRLVQKYGPLAGKVAAPADIQAALPFDAALVAWVDLKPRGLKAVDPSGEHWGVVVGAKGQPVWIRLSGTGTENQWTEDDSRLRVQLPDAVRHRPASATIDPGPLIQRLRDQRLVPLTAALKSTTDGLPAARRLIVLPSAGMTGVPIEALLQPGDPWAVSYAPSATIFKYLREQPGPNVTPASWPWATRTMTVRTSRANPSRCLITACCSTSSSAARTRPTTD